MAAAASPRQHLKGKYALFGALAGASVALDQITKVWVTRHLGARGAHAMMLAGRKLVLVYAENTGVAFSRLTTLPGGRVILSLLSLVALGLVVHYLRRTPPDNRRGTVALGLICGGALGNMIDRVRLGFVVDFIRVDVGVWPFNPWPVFNVADAVLVAGVALIALSSLGRKPARPSPAR
jgi:signal peptidase II